MKNQTFGIEIEMTAITREHAAQVIAAHFGTSVEYIGGTYDTRIARDTQGRAWKVVSDSSIADENKYVYQATIFRVPCRSDCDKKSSPGGVNPGCR